MTTNMDARPIGVFDSGIGGLTTVKKLAQLLPRDDIIYLGDTGRVPYGSRSRDTIIRYSLQAASFLADFDIKVMVIACNTACSSAYDTINGKYEMPVYEVVTEPVKTAVRNTKNGKIGVIGTNATIRSGAYEIAIESAAPDAQVFSVPCPLFVPLVENGRINTDDVAALDIAEGYLSELRAAGIDTLILGCTHYPLLRSVIQKVVGDSVALIDSGAETAKLVAADMSKRGMDAHVDSKGAIRYFVTDSIEGFSDLASMYMEEDIRVHVEQVSLE